MLSGALAEARRGCWIPWSRSNWQLWATQHGCLELSLVLGKSNLCSELPNHLSRPLFYFLRWLSTGVVSPCCFDLSVPHDRRRWWPTPFHVTTYLFISFGRCPLKSSAHFWGLFSLQLLLLNYKNSLCTWDTGTSLDVWPGNFGVYSDSMKERMVLTAFLCGGVLLWRKACLGAVKVN